MRVLKATSPIILLTMLATLLLRNQIILGKAWWYGDIFTFFYPVRSYVAERLLKLQMPLWQPYSNMGIAAIAEPQYQVFYPPLWLTLPLPTHFGMALMLWLHILLSGFALYFFLRVCMRLKKAASLFGAIAYMLSGFIQGHVGHLIHVLAYPYLPILLTVVHRAFATDGVKSSGLWAGERDGTTTWATVCGIVISLQLLTGSQFAYYSFLTAMAFSIFAAAHAKVRWHSFALFWLCAIAICLSICAIQMLPTFEVARFSARPPSFKFASDNSLPPLLWLTLSTLPNYYGTYLTGFVTHDIWTDGASAFVGHSTILLSLTCIVVSLKRNRLAAFFAMAALASLIISFGIYTPLWKVLSPIASCMFKFRCPSRWLLVYTLSLSILSSIGMHNLLEGSGFGGATKSEAKLLWLLPIFVVLYAICLTAVLFLHWRQSQDAFALCLDSLLLALLWWYALLTLRWVMRGFSHCDALLLTLGLTCELFVLSLGMHFSAGAKRELIEQPAKVAGLIRENERYFSERFPVAPYLLANRYLRMKKFSTREDALARAQIELLKPSLNLLTLRRSVDTEGELVSRPLWSFPFVRFRDLRHKDNERLYRLAGVKCIVSIWRYARFKLRARTKDGVFIYEDPEAMPLIYPVENVRIVRTTDEAIELITKRSFNPKTEVALLPMSNIENMDGDAKVTNASTTSADVGKVTVRRWECEVCEIECEGKQSSWLIWLECFHPGWRAFVDGRQTSIHCANGAFMAVRVGSGRHRITFAFLPTSYSVGAFITLCTISALIGISIFRLVMRFKASNSSHH